MTSLKHSLTMGLAIVCSLKPSSFGACYSDDAVNDANGTYGDYFGTLKQTYYPPAADCQDYTIPVDVAWDKLVYNATKWDNAYDLEDFLSVATTRAGANYPSPFGGPVQVKDTYQIAASFCTPTKKTGKETTVILATHGIGPGRAHWNSPWQPDQYNFVQWAVGQGYSVFFYDRLGCGASQK
jgi:hypothetical protein